MKRGIFVFFVVVFSLMFIVGCSNSTQDRAVQPQVQNYVPIERPAPLALERVAMDIEWIDAATGGTVGGETTNNNSFTIPPGAIDQSRYFILLDLSDYFGILCLPSGEFNAPVTVTLSYAGLDFDGYELEDLVVLTDSEDNGWEPIDGELQWDYDNQTCTFQVNHFTRYSWGKPGN